MQRISVVRDRDRKMPTFPRGCKIAVSSDKGASMRLPSLFGVVLALSQILSAQQRTVPVPAFTGPLAVTADSYPEMAASRTQSPIDLKQLGYVEEEFIVSGSANIYDWD